jgi:predicted acetyltransferase
LVKAVGVAAFGVDANYRGRGAGLQLLRSHLQEAAEANVALSLLYPATWKFYRRSGYELAGVTHQFKLDLKLLPTNSSAGRTYRATPTTMLEAISKALLNNGHYVQDNFIQAWLEDGLYRFNFLLSNPQYGGHILLDPNGQSIGYAIVEHQKGRTLWFLDHAADTEEAAKVFLNFLAGHRSIFDTAYILGNVKTPYNLMLPEKAISIAESFPWMLRIVDVKQAMQQRGYPEALNARLVIKVEDDLIAKNTGCFRVECAKGTAQVQTIDKIPKNETYIELSISALAPLYTGYIGPQRLQIMGRAKGNPQGLSTASLMFSGPSPWINGLF